LEALKSEHSSRMTYDLEGRLMPCSFKSQIISIIESLEFVDTVTNKTLVIKHQVPVPSGI
jgi:hypothetical protein